MWCRNCQQDVPGVRGQSFDSLCCSRCGEQPKSQQAIPKPKGAVLPVGVAASAELKNNGADIWTPEETPVLKSTQPVSGNEPKPSAKPPAVSDDAVEKFNSELRRIDKIISIWGEAKYLRFDNAHRGTATNSEPDEDRHENLEFQPVAADIPEEEDSPLKQTHIFAVCLTFGGLLAIVLGAAHAIALSGPRLSHDVRIAAGFVCAGALGVIFGLWFEVGRLRRQVKSLAKD